MKSQTARIEGTIIVYTTDLDNLQISKAEKSFVFKTKVRLTDRKSKLIMVYK